MIPFDELVRLDLNRLVAALQPRALQPRALQPRALQPREPAATGLEPDQWLGVVQLLGTRLVEEGRGLGAGQWPAAAAAYRYALESALGAGAITAEEVVLRRLNLSAALLREVAPDPAVDLLDPGAAAELALRALPLPIDDARRLAPRWRELDIEQIRKLRLAKNLLRPALMINESLRDPRIAAWEQVVPVLP